jgi:hypothetical protein
VHESRRLVTVRVAAAPRTRECVLDGALAARPVELVPHRRNEVREPLGFHGAGRQPAVGRRAPDPRCGGDQDLVSPAHRQLKLEQPAAEPLEQERAARDVGSQQLRAAVTRREPQRGGLMRSGVAVARDDQLEHGARAVALGRLRDERLRRLAERAADRDLPLRLERPNERRKLLDPLAGAGSQRLLAHNWREQEAPSGVEPL